MKNRTQSADAVKSTNHVETAPAKAPPDEADRADSAQLARDELSLEVTIEVHGLTTVIRIAGEVNCHAADRLQLALTPVLDRRPLLVVVDLAGATLFSSLAISALVCLRRSLARWGGTTKLVAVPPHVRETLEVTRVIELFEVFDTFEQAIA
jgi:anti-anti-sigma factor